MSELINRRIEQATRIIKGYLFKWKYDLIGFGNLPKVNRTARNPQLVVSLTSYGRRVANVVPYTLISLLRQSLKPDRIVLWLDRENWSADNLPKKIKRLQKYGIEVRFCKDLRSYKKLLPALKVFPDDVIVTVDDDEIYRKDLIEGLYKAYLSDPNKIYSHHACYPSLNPEGQLRPYNDWFTPASNKHWIMPLGVSGVLYPPHCLHPDVDKEELFMKLCPLADDLWFWIMALRQGTSHVVLDPDRVLGCCFDTLYQFLHKDSNLAYFDYKLGLNNSQMKAICAHFNLDFQDLTHLN